MGLFSRRKKKNIYVFSPNPKPDPFSDSPLTHIPSQEEMEQELNVLRLAAAMDSDDSGAVARTLLELEQNADRALKEILRTKLLPRITDEGALMNVAASAKDADIRMGAAKRLQDPENIVRCMLTISHKGAWQLADKLKALPDGAERLRYVYEKSADADVRRTALEALGDLTDAPEVWIEYIRLTRYSGVAAKIKDTAVAEKAVRGDESPDVRNSLLRYHIGELSSETLRMFLAREDNGREERAQAAELLFKRGDIGSGEFTKELEEIVDSRPYLALEMGERGDARAVPALERLAHTEPFSAQASAALGNIPTLESVAALRRLLETDRRAAITAAVSLARLYRNSGDAAVRSAVGAIEQKRWYEHTDMGEYSSSCHSDVAGVVFTLEE